MSLTKSRPCASVMYEYVLNVITGCAEPRNSSVSKRATSNQVVTMRHTADGPSGEEVADDEFRDSAQRS